MFSAPDNRKGTGIDGAFYHFKNKVYLISNNNAVDESMGVAAHRCLLHRIADTTTSVVAFLFCLFFRQV